MDIRQRLLVIFQTEHAEHVSRIRGVLDGFEARGHVSPGPDLDEAFRSAHSLKGAARAVDLKPVETLAHGLESLLAKVREGTLELGMAGIRVIRRGLDASEDIMAAVAQNAAVPDPAGALEAIRNALEGKSASPAPAAPAPVPAPEPVIPIVEAPVAAPSNGTSAPHSPAVPSTLNPQPSTSPAVSVAAPESVRVSVDTLDRVLRSAGQLFSETMRQDRVEQELTQLERRITEMGAGWKRLQRAAGAPLRTLAGNPELAPVAEYLETLVGEVQTLAGEVRRARLQQRRSAWSLRQLGEQLQDDVRQARMIPAESILGGFRKMMRDLARDAGREIEFRVSGLEVQADRVVLQELKDPLMHLLRNSLSHGIELPEDRARAGKPSVGQIGLQLEVSGSRLRVVVEDDGRGVDVQKVAAAAVRAGILAADQVETWEPEELARLIFHPGLSTAGAVNDLSGRGMGLSVVQQSAAQLQGEIEVLPRAGGGTTFALSVPISVSTHSLLLVECQGQTYGIPSGRIARLHRVRQSEVYPLDGRPVATVEGEPLPLASLADLLGLADATIRTEGKFLSVLVLKSGRERLGLVVDALLHQTDAVIRDLGPQFAGLRGIAGGILLGDGEIVLVLNPSDLADAFLRQRESTTLSVQAPEAAALAPCVLVVDDSITTRTLEKSILEAHGYRVRVAVDGVEALAQLRAEPVDLIISDVEMPRMDGFALLQAVRSDPQLERTPLILVTSLEKREHKEKGLVLGADAYVVKRSFDQTDLLETIKQLL